MKGYLPEMMGKSELLTDIVEVQECGKRLANHYLEHGYILLDIQTATRAQRYNQADQSVNAQQYYVRRNPIFVLGRPKGVEPAPRMEEGGKQNEETDNPGPRQ